MKKDKQKYFDNEMREVIRLHSKSDSQIAFVKMKFSQKSTAPPPTNTAKVVATVGAVALMAALSSGGGDCDSGGGMSWGEVGATAGMVSAIWHDPNNSSLKLSGIITIDENCLSIFTHDGGCNFTKKSIKKAFSVPYENIFSVSVDWTFGYGISIKHYYKQKAYELNVRFFKIAKGLERQKQEVVKLVEFFKKERDAIRVVNTS